MTQDPSARSVWVLTGDKAGDNAQGLALARALPWPSTPKRLVFNPLHLLWNVVLGASLVSLDRRASDALAPPWPDLVLGIGRRSVPVARWIRRQSGGRARLVRLGRPAAPYGWFDLIVTTPQYGLPECGNIAHLPLPLTDIGSEGPREARPGVDDLPHPRIALLVGGSSGGLRFGAEQARALGATASALAARKGGALLVSTSRRTEPAAAAALAGALGAPHRLHRYGESGNPYRGYLALADAVIVTADSASMMADAVASRRPVLIAPLPARRHLGHYFGRIAARLPRYDAAVDVGLIPRPRDIARIGAQLVERGHARWLTAEDDLRPPAALYDAAGALASVVRRIVALVEQGRDRPR